MGIEMGFPIIGLLDLEFDLHSPGTVCSRTGVRFIGRKGNTLSIFGYGWDDLTN